MTELETVQRAKMYLDKLARGIDPISNREVPGDSVLNNVRLARCFLYVSDLLDQVIANGGTVGQPVRNLEFRITPQQLARVWIQDQPVRITEFADAVHQAVGEPRMKKPAVKRITDWLVDQGLMTQTESPDGRSFRIPTERGLAMGMSTRLRKSKDGEYQAVFYDRNMQRFLLDHLNSIFPE